MALAKLSNLNLLNNHKKSEPSIVKFYLISERQKSSATICIERKELSWIKLHLQTIYLNQNRLC
ncbi:hypothetical protein, partial [Clostridioides difficile]|uniref:hypothetical protein n=1 Tax=Clostridioides difficile TaxID=1496 RepID=UPI001A90F01A